MLLGKHKEVVDKLRDELVDNNIACDSEKPIADLSYKKIDQLKYLGHVVKEILRLCPPAGGGFRKVLRDFELGVCIIITIWTASSEFGIRAVSPEPPLLAHKSSESRGTFRQKTRSLAPLNGWACAVKICHDGMLEDTNSLDGAHL